MSKKLLLIFAAFCLFSCSKEEDEGFTPTEYAVSGKVEKGPFISGSTITLQPLDGKLNPLGNTFPATITSDEGNFDFGSLKLDAPYALLTTNGYFFNEIYGKLSDAPITLQAIVDLSDRSTVNVNILTHLKKERLKKLVADGASFTNANQQAQTELLTNFGLQKYAQTDVSRFSITAGTDEAAALILVSSALLNDRREAQLTEALSKLSQEFTAKGEFSETSKTDYEKKAKALNQDRIVRNIVERYETLGKTVTVKNLSYYIDWDNNGVAGDELGDPSTEIQLSFEQTELAVPMEGGLFQIQINANVPYSFTDPLDDGSDDEIQMEGIFKTAPISYTKNVEQQNVLVMKIHPASSMLMKQERIDLYSMDGKIHSTLVVSQLGDPTKTEDLFSEKGEESFKAGVYERAILTLNYLHTMEGLYAKSYRTADPIWSPLGQSPVSADSDPLQKIWEYAYQSMRGIRQMIALQGDATFKALLTSYMACIETSLYYEMAVMWGNVVYAQGTDETVMNSHQLSTEQLFAELIVKLESGMEVFADKGNRFNSMSNWLFVSKDTPRALLAKMHMYLGDYAKAYEQLRSIVNAGHYQLEANRATALSGYSRELIYGSLPDKMQLPFTMLESDGVMPSITYTEVLLSLAECAYWLGKEGEANDYLNKVLAKRSIQPSGDFAASLQKAWASELKGTGTYFAFLKRNDWAMKLLDMKEYCLILPIPVREVHLSPNVKQNPGY